MLRWTSLALVLGVTVAVTAVCTPIVRAIAVRRGLVVQPDAERIHKWPVPQLGGIAMFIGFLAGLATAWLCGGFQEVFAVRLTVIGLVIGPAIVWLVGTIDDLHEVSAPAKTAGLVLGGSALYWFGISMDYFRIPFAGTIVLSADWKPLLVVLWVFAMSNAVNLIDGLDGLAAGIVAIASGSFLLYGHKLLTAGVLTFDNPSILIATIILGMCLGFLPFNFHPAKIFMGDGGALLLGTLMAVSTMLVGGRTTEPFSGQTYFFFAPLFIPIFILGVPIIDMVFAIFRRARSRSGVATRDIDHLHHRLIRLGHGHWRSVIILWSWTALLSAFVLFPAYSGRGNGLVPLGALALGLALYTWFRPRQLRGGANDDNDEATAHIDSVSPDASDADDFVRIDPSR